MIYCTWLKTCTVATRICTLMHHIHLYWTVLLLLLHSWPFLGIAYFLLCPLRILLYYHKLAILTDSLWVWFSQLRSPPPQLSDILSLLSNLSSLDYVEVSAFKLLIDSPAGFHSAPHANAGVRKLRSSAVCRKACQMQRPPHPETGTERNNLPH